MRTVSAEEAAALVEAHGTALARAIRGKSLKDVLKVCNQLLGLLRHSDEMLCEEYFRIYEGVFVELQHVIGFLRETTSRPFEELYEVVQHAGNVLPRLYMLATVASLPEEASPELFCDIIEMLKGVQHPMRGIFLRYYFFQCIRDKGAVNYDESSAFITAYTRNAKDAATLWVRLRFQGASASDAKLMADWEAATPLVLVHVVYLCELGLADVDVHRAFVLPLLEYLENSPGLKKLPQAQEILMETLVTHLRPTRVIMAVAEILSCTVKLEPGVRIRQALSTLMNRVADFVEDERQVKESLRTEVPCSLMAVYGENRAPDANSLKEDISDEAVDVAHLLTLMRDHVQEVLESTMDETAPKKMPLASALDLLCCYEAFVLRLAPERADLINECYHALHTLLDGVGDDADSYSGVVEMLQLCRLRTLPELHYFHLCLHRRFLGSSFVAVWRRLLQKWEENPESFLFTPSTMKSFTLHFKEGITQDSLDDPQEPDEEVVLCTELVVILLQRHLTPECVSPEDLIQLLTELQTEGRVLTRDFVFYSHPAFFRLMLAKCCEAPVVREWRGEEPAVWSLAPVDVCDSRDALLSNDCIANLIDGLKAAGLGAVAHRLLCEACEALCGAVRRLPTESVRSLLEEYIAQSIDTLKEDVPDGSQLEALALSVKCIVESGDTLEVAFYESIAAEIAQHSTKLLRRQTQCQALIIASHLFAANRYRQDNARALECLQRALKIADVSFQCNVSTASLYMECLEAYVSFYEGGNELISGTHVVNLLHLTRNNLEIAVKKTAASAATKKDSVAHCWRHFEAFVAEMAEKECTRSLVKAMNVK
ncbi:MAG: hypothetical protein KVP17_003022 [Porospora cf. gigantea B]|uniref:uncharacterized protein n=1 Tax=Porospora cf. gigantea B TaxID=2853592 RepID=UPI003571B145|nr:MAG: hypothetical protein KVP17_003022 [Porospora cf. gigantea B]